MNQPSSVGTLELSATIRAVCTGCPYWVSPTWQSQHPASSPVGLESASLVYDSARNQVVLFGGYAGGAQAGTWTFDGTTWTQKSPTTSPPARYGAQMAFDTARGQVVLFGGATATSVLADTWVWDGTNWTQKAPATSPPARSAGVADYFPPTSQVIMFGGYGGGWFGDTWGWNGTTWTNLAPAGSPSVRSDAGLAYDSSAQKLVLYGGDTTGNVYLSDTWTFSSGTWTQNTTAGGPGNLYGPSLAYDPTLARVVMFGGYSDSAASSQDQSYVYTNGQWGQLGVPITPAARYHSAVVRSPSNGQLVLTGGTDGVSTFGDTHTFDWSKAGAQRGYKLDKQALTDRLGLAVNAAGGDVVVTANDLSLTSDGIGLGMTRFYNSQQALQSYTKGYGWFFDTAEDLYISGQPDGSKLLTGFAGSSYGGAYFHTNGNGTYLTPPGIDADLTSAGGYDIVTYRSSHRVQKFDQSNFGALVSDVDRNNNGLHFTYTSGSLTSISDAQGHTATYTYTAGLLTKITDNSGRFVTYSYTGSYLTGVTDLNGKTTAYSYDNATGALTTITDANGNITKLAENGLQEVTSIIRVTNVGAGTGPTTTYSYSPAISTETGTVLRTLSVAPDQAGTGTGTTYATNHAGQALKITDALGRNRSGTYTANADVATAVDAMGLGQNPGNTTTNTYDTDFRGTGSSAPTGAASAVRYAEAAGTVTSPVAHWQPSGSTDPDGNAATFTYDGPGNIIKAQDTTGGPTGGVATSFGIYGNTGVTACGGRTGQTGQVCTATDGRGKVTAYTYFTNGTLQKIDNPAPLGDPTFTYDTLGRIATATDGKAQVTAYSYDNLDRVTQTRYAGTTTCTSAQITAGTCITKTYDNDGNLTQTVDQTGTTSVVYDPLSRETSRTLPSTGATSLTYDASGNVLTATDAAGTITYTYDNANQLTTLLEPGGSCTAVPKDRCTTFGYNNNGARTTTTYPTGSTSTVMTMTPDNSGRVATIKAVTGATVHSDLSYTYSRLVGATATDGVLTRTRTNNQASGSVGRTTTYGYDTLARLTSALEKDSAGTTTTASWAYGYDNAGNRTSATLSPLGTGAATAFTYNDANQILTRAGAGGFTYDANGAETAAVGSTTRTAGAWNAKQQLTSSTVAGTALPFTYTGEGNNTRLSVGTTTLRNTALTITAQTTSGATTTFIRDPGGTLIGTRTGTTTHYYIYDGLGSVVGLISPTGVKANSYSYDPYGQARSSTGTVVNPYRYTGGYLDSTTGLYKLGIRYYDPTLGRFTQLDPTAMDRQYIYVGNNPVSDVDPTGACGIVSCIVGAASAVATALAVGTAAFHVAALIAALGEAGVGGSLGILAAFGPIGLATFAAVVLGYVTYKILTS